MAEILVLYLADKKAAATRLADAMAAAGYAVASREGAQPQELAGLAQAAEPPCVLVWSRAAVSSAVQDGWLGQVRTARGLIEVSFDGITPPYADESRVILLSGWRGEPFHPGWQRVLERLKSVPSSPRPAPPAEPVRREQRPDRKPVADRAPTDGEAPRKKPAILVGALLLAGAAAAAAAWIGGSGSAQDAPAAVDSPAPRAAAPAAVAAPSPSAAATSAPAPAPAAAVQNAAAPAVEEQRVPERPARRKAAAAQETPRKSARAADGPVKRYSRRHSATMRAFCEGTGRSTPQCRTFLRSTRDDSSR